MHTDIIAKVTKNANVRSVCFSDC